VPAPTNPSLDALAAFFASAEVARRATRPLAPEAEVALEVAGASARFGMQGGAATVAPGTAQDPDFTLELPAGAVERLVAGGLEEVGNLGVEFFRLATERDPALRVRIRIHASTARLVARGYLSVLLLGGLGVAMWLLRKGIASPRAAIDRLRGK
jgi:hypothetical protein